MGNWSKTWVFSSYSPRQQYQRPLNFQARPRNRVWKDVEIKIMKMQCINIQYFTHRIGVEGGALEPTFSSLPAASLTAAVQSSRALGVV